MPLSGGTQSTGEYPTLQVADGTFATAQADPALTHTLAIANVTDLQNMANDLTGNYYLTGNIDASATSTWNAGAGFVPVGAYSLTLNTEFAGTLDGCGYTITGLYINRATTDRIGLFGSIAAWNSADVKIANLTLADCNFTGENYAIGGLIGEVGSVGSANKTYIYNCHTSGTLAAVGSAGNDFGIGGMVGVVSVTAGREFTAYDSTSSCSISTTGTAGFDQIGGFVGYITGGGCYNCRASGSITANASLDTTIGGFVGQADGIGATAGIYEDCSATGNVSGHDYIGGFCGIATLATFTRCSARGNATANSGIVGGFVANTYGTGCTWTDCYAWGNATDSSVSNSAGGFVGETNADTTFTNCYAIGVASGYVDPIWGSTGGFMGWDYGGTSTYTSIFWDTEASGLSADGHDGGAVGHVTSWMQTKANYQAVSWDFTTVWELTETTGDSGKYRIDGTTVYGFGHLIGESVIGLMDGVVVDEQVVSDAGTITLPSAPDVDVNMHFGLAYESKLKPMKPVSQPDMMSKTVTCKQMGISVHNTDEITYGVHDDDMKAINFDDVQWHNKCEIDGLFTGTVAVSVPDGFSVNLPLQITTDAPLPCTVRAMIPKVD